jgi:hypothetical protein
MMSVRRVSSLMLIGLSIRSRSAHERDQRRLHRGRNSRAFECRRNREGENHSCHLQLVGERFDEVHHRAGADTVTRDSERGRSCERS